jgi:hypothetical protein
MGSEQSQVIRGRCMCGDIRYEFTGPMLDAVHCHCESCRRQSSSPFSTFFNVDKKCYTQGTPVVYKSSGEVECTHCGRCGAPITYERLDFGDDLPCYAKGFRGDPIGHGPPRLPPVSFENVRTNSANTTAARDSFARQGAAAVHSARTP